MTTFSSKIQRRIKQSSIIAALTVFSFGIISCGDSNKIEPEQPATIKELKFDVPSYTEWKYFSFAKGEFVAIDKDNFETDLNWDIAFMRFYIRTNGGTSGKGKGAMLDTQQTTFDAVATIPTTGYIYDTPTKIINASTMPPTHLTSSVNIAPKVGKNVGWANYSPPMGPWTFNNNIFVVRTADGKYAKIKMVSFLNDKDKPGHITLQYVYPFN